MLAAINPWKPPAELDEYRLSRLIGSGAMGQVYLAHDTLLDRPVAIKFIGVLDPSSSLKKRFLVEARAIARIQHPNVVAIYRVGELEDRPYLISEFIRGESLDKLKKPIAGARALELAIGLARGLAAAHRRGVLHRDIKTANAILADNGDAKLVDFGLAKVIDAREARDGRETRDLSRDLPGAAGGGAAGGAGLGGGPIGSLTRPGAIMGTPYYAAPELWTGAPATRRSDVYSLGVVLYELCTGRPPFARARDLQTLARLVCAQNAKPLRVAAPAIDPNFAAVVDRCLSRDPEQRYGSGDELRDALEQISFRQSALAATIPEGNPYRGLLAFDGEHRALFFGRGSETRAVLERLRQEPFILVAGDSGSGKSSLCRAGIVPLAEEGALGARMDVAAFTPGKRPLAALSAALEPHLREYPAGEYSGIDDAGVADLDALLATPAGTQDVARELDVLLARLRARVEGGAGLLIFVDQLEELVTLGDPDGARGVAEFLVHAASTLSGLRVLATVRGDHLTRVASLPGISEEIPRAMFLLGQLSGRGIREAIIGPSDAKGVSFEDESIVEELARAGARTESGLPLLQFALSELWDARDISRSLITRDALDAIGGVEGALARHADNVIGAMLPAQRRAARRIFTKLVTAEGAKARRTGEELASADGDGSGALEALVRGRLVIARELEEGTVYEVAHEALIRSWSALREWLEHDSGKKVVRERLARAAAEWRRLAGTPEALWGERQLKEVAVLDVEELGADEAGFLRASRAAVNRSLWKRRATAVLVPLALIGAYAGVSAKQREDLARRVTVHLDEAAKRNDDARAIDGDVQNLRREAFAAFDGKDRESGETAWARATARAAQVDESYGRAAQALEAALALDPSRADVRARLGLILYDRAVLAERDERPEHLAEHLRRLAVYDASGELRRRFHGLPAHISISTTPPGAEVSMESDAAGGGTTQRALGTTPLGPIELERGSHVVIISAPGRAEIRYPLHVGRGEELNLEIPLPASADIPEGFVHIPRGRFSYGSSAEEELRRDFFNTAPVHDVITEAYSIARHETTYGDWIEYLSSLPHAERAARTPKLEGGFSRALELIALPGGSWQLTIQPGAQQYSAAAGKNIVYAGRKLRASQNWLALPVSGITIADAEAYASWLDSTGKVPGARLCTDFEWERAARGADRRSYPGGRDPKPDDFNFDETYGRDQVAFGADEVGSHPASRSPFGVDDLAGNVWELVQSSMKDGEWVARGGSYHQAQKICRTMNREIIGEPTVRDITLGLRICAGSGRARIARPR